MLTKARSGQTCSQVSRKHTAERSRVIQLCRGTEVALPPVDDRTSTFYTICSRRARRWTGAHRCQIASSKAGMASRRVVVTSQPARCDEGLVLQLNSQAGATRLYPVRVVSCEMDSRHGPMRFSLHVESALTRISPGPVAIRSLARNESSDDECSVAQRRPARGAGRQQWRLPDRIMHATAGRNGRVARSGVRGRTPLRVVSGGARPHAAARVHVWRASSSCRWRLREPTPCAAPLAGCGDRRREWKPEGDRTIVW